MSLSFRLGKIPVRVAPSFLLMTVLLGGIGRDLSMLVAWVLIVFVSVMLHELGHATMGMAFGLEPRIDLHGMGGTTAWSAERAQKLSAFKRVAISLAGPLAGFAVGAVVLAARLAGAIPDTEIAQEVYRTALFVNVGWGIFNLMPMLPLDGGSVMRHTLNGLTGGRGDRASFTISVVVAMAVVALSLFASAWWIALLGASFVASNGQALRATSAQDHDAPMREALEQAYAALEAKDGARVLVLAKPVALRARTTPVRAEALQLVAFGFLLEGRVADADAAIAAMPQGFAPHPSLVEMRAGWGVARR